MVVLLFACAGMASAAETPETYTVQKDDILSRIAYRFHTTWPKLAKINKLKNPSLIHPGDVIALYGPEVKKIETTAGVKHATAQKARACEQRSAVTQLGFPKQIERELQNAIMEGRFEKVTSQDITNPVENARKYIARDSTNEYAFIHPETNGCAWRLKLVTKLPNEQYSLMDPPLLHDRDGKKQILASPLGPTPGHVIKNKKGATKIMVQNGMGENSQHIKDKPYLWKYPGRAPCKNCEAVSSIRGLGYPNAVANALIDKVHEGDFSKIEIARGTHFDAMYFGKQVRKENVIASWKEGHTEAAYEYTVIHNETRYALVFPIACGNWSKTTSISPQPIAVVPPTREEPIKDDRVVEIIPPPPPEPTPGNIIEQNCVTCPDFTILATFEALKKEPPEPWNPDQ